MKPTEPTPVPGSTPDNPLFFKFLRDEDDQISLKKIVVMLALTALSGYLATQAQRAGSSPDQLKSARMRVHRAAETVSRRQAAFWSSVADHHHDLYEIARL